MQEDEVVASASHSGPSTGISSDTPDDPNDPTFITSIRKPITPRAASLRVITSGKKRTAESEEPHPKRVKKSSNISPKLKRLNSRFE